MSYNQGYGQNNQQGYGQYNPYGQQNPYEQRDNSQTTQRYDQNVQSYAQNSSYPQQDGYGQQRPQVQHHSSSQYDEERNQGGYEMSAVNTRNNDPNRILNEIRAIDSELRETEDEVQRLSGLRRQFLDLPDSQNLEAEISALSDSIMNVYRNLTKRVVSIKQNPESGNPRNRAQVGKIDRQLKTSLKNFNLDEKKYRADNEEQFDRQYRIIRPDASEAEIREAKSVPAGGQLFSQALMQSDRRKEADASYRRVETRHKAIQKIEQDVYEIARLMNEVEAAVMQQEDQVVAIEDKAAVAEQHVTQGTVELDGAVKKAKAARRKKWICFGIVVLIIIIVVGVAAGVVESQKHTNN